MKDFKLYRVVWWTHTTNNQLREYSRGFKDKADGLLFIEKKKRAPKVCNLWLMRDDAKILTGTRYLTDHELKAKY
jgi:hypothetical protein